MAVLATVRREPQHCLGCDPAAILIAVSAFAPAFRLLRSADRNRSRAWFDPAVVGRSRGTGKARMTGFSTRTKGDLLGIVR